MTFKEVIGIDGPIARIGTLLFDMLFINILWILFGGPALVLVLHLIPAESAELYLLITILSVIVMLFFGTSTTAAYAASGKRFRHEESYTFKDFWKSYRQNLKQGIVLTLLFGVVLGVLGYSIWVELYNVGLFKNLIYVLIPVQAFVTAEVVFMLMYAFALLARFDMKTRDIIKYSFLMANKHLPTTLLLVVMLAVVLAGTFLWNLGVGFIAFGAYFYLASGLLERVFKNYMPEEETEDSGEELTEEEAFQKERIKRQEQQVDKDRQAILEKYTGKRRDE